MARPFGMFRLLIGRVLVVGMALAGCARAQPFIYYRGIVNAASYAPPGLAHGGIAQGSMFSVFGRNLGPAQSSLASFPLGTTFQAVSIEACRAGRCVAPIPILVSRGQINAIMPSDTPLGWNAVRVTYQGVSGNFAPVNVVASNVGIFSVNSAGSGPASAYNFVAPGNEPLNSSEATARRGQVITLWGTGLGPALNPDNVAPQPGDLATPVEVFIGGKLAASKLYSGRSPCCSGIDQIIVEIPPDAPEGCYVPVHVRTGAQAVSNSVTIAISPDGSACKDSHNPFLPAFLKGGKIGAFFGERWKVDADIDPLPAFQQLTEWARLMFREEKSNPYQFEPVLSLPPVGSCTTYSFPGNLLRDLVGYSGATLRGLDGGATARVSTATAQADIGAAILPGHLGGLIGGDLSAIYGANTEGSLSSPGGADVGPVNASFSAPPFPVWTNRDSIRSIRRNQPLTLTWAGREPGVMAVIGGAVDSRNNATAVFTCLADATAGSMTVPSWVLQHLPLSRRRLWELEAMVALGLGPELRSGRIEATGLDTGSALFRSWVANSVVVQE